MLLIHSGQTAWRLEKEGCCGKDIGAIVTSELLEGGHAPAEPHEVPEALV